MLDNFQSQKAVARQIKDGMSYFLMKSPEKKDIGYIAVKPETDRMYVSKFYVCAPERGRGAGKAAVRYMEELTAAAGKNKMALNVNKNNVNSIEAYKKFGFRTAKSEVNDIGNGFVMDDYVMEKEVNGQRSRF
jgi:ribosomal protein S18 acetylase RimI-like enzyme